MCPSAGRVCQEQHIQAHLPIILRQRRGGVDRSFAGCDGHGGGVADNNRPLHQALAGARVGKLGELADGLDDLASPLAASCDNHNIDLGVSACDLLQDRLARAEWPGDAVCATLDDGEHRVDNPHAGAQRLGRHETAIADSQGSLDGPILLHGNRDFRAVRACERSDFVIHRIAASWDDILEFPVALQRERSHDFVRENTFRTCADRVASGDGIAGLGGGCEVPGFFRVQACDVLAGLEEEALGLCQARQRVLQAIVYLAQQTRAQRYREHLVAELDDIVDL